MVNGVNRIGSLWAEVIREGSLDEVGSNDQPAFSQAEGINATKSDGGHDQPSGPFGAESGLRRSAGARRERSSVTSEGFSSSSWKQRGSLEGFAHGNDPI